MVLKLITKVKSSYLNKYFLPILILLGIIIVFHIATVSVVYNIRNSIESEYSVLQENLLEKEHVYHKIVTSINHVISYDFDQKNWEETKQDLWNFNSPIMGERLLTERIRDDILNRILGEDPLRVKERRNITLAEYRVKLRDIFQHASLLRNSAPGLERETLLVEYQDKMQCLLAVLIQYHDEQMEIHSEYFSYLKKNLLNTMSLLGNLVYSLVAFVALTVILVVLFIFERRRFEVALINSNFKLKQTEKEREKYIAELKKALSEVHTLQGFLPICSNCKKIRDDKGYWQQIEQYIMERSDTQFSHGICPDCIKKLYPEMADKLINKSNNTD